MNTIEILRDYVLRNHPDATAFLTRPLREDGIWSLDVDLGDRGLSVQWSTDTGFGLSTVSNENFGEGPDEVLMSLDEVQHRVAQLLTTNERTTPSLGVLLSRLRESRGVTQQALASRLNIRQSTISGIEHREDVQLSTLRRIVSALGGLLEVFAVFGDARHRIMSPSYGVIYHQSSHLVVGHEGDNNAFKQLRKTNDLHRATVIANTISKRNAVIEMV